MAKRKSTEGKKLVSELELAHHPFGALAGLRETLPEGRSPETLMSADAPSTGTSEVTTEHPKSKIVLRREKKGRGGKTITRVQGLPVDELNALAGAMKRALGCGATVEGEDLVLHGSLMERAASWLRTRGEQSVVMGN